MTTDDITARIIEEGRRKRMDAKIGRARAYLAEVALRHDSEQGDIQGAHDHLQSLLDGVDSTLFETATGRRVD